jgi:GAF domain-containing protein
MNRAISGNSDEHLQALANLSHAITSDIFIDDILNLVVLAAARATSMDACHLWLVDRAGGNSLRLVATHVSGLDMAAGKAPAMGEAIARCALEEKRLVVIGDVSRDGRFAEKELAAELAIVSMASVPMMDDSGSPAGAINCFARKAHKLTQHDIDLVTSLAGQTAKIIRDAERMVRASIIKIELETLKKIALAQKIIMDRKKLAGGMAIKWLEQRSTDTCTSLHDVAEAILLANECEL